MSCLPSEMYATVFGLIRGYFCKVAFSLVENNCVRFREDGILVFRLTAINIIRVSKSILCPMTKVTSAPNTSDDNVIPKIVH